MTFRSVGAAKRQAKPRPANPFVIPAGWHRGATNVRQLFAKSQKREPDESEEGRLKYIVKYTKQAFRAPINESTFENGYGILKYYLSNPARGLPPKKLVNAGGAIAENARARVQQHINEYKAQHSSFWSKLNPVKLISAAANVITKVAPFVDMAIGLIPGAGQIYNAAKTAVNVGMSLAKGRPLTDAFIEGALNMMPGGAIAQRAARAVVSLAKGRSLTGAMLDQVKEQFPGAEKAITVAAGIAEGRKLQDIAIDEVKGLAKGQLKGLALPIPKGIEVPAGMRAGFKIGMGVLKRNELAPGVPLTPAAALAIRKRLSKVDRLGFDRALAMRALKNYRAGSKNVTLPRKRLQFAVTAPSVMITDAGLVQL